MDMYIFTINTWIYQLRSKLSNKFSYFFHQQLLPYQKMRLSYPQKKNHNNKAPKAKNITTKWNHKAKKTATPKARDKTEAIKTAICCAGDFFRAVWPFCLLSPRYNVCLNSSDVVLQCPPFCPTWWKNKVQITLFWATQRYMVGMWWINHHRTNGKAYLPPLYSHKLVPCLSLIHIWRCRRRG